jgi:hypothetical protein
VIGVCISGIVHVLRVGVAVGVRVGVRVRIVVDDRIL